jgi:hypothetical protein
MTKADAFILYICPNIEKLYKTYYTVTGVRYTLYITGGSGTFIRLPFIAILLYYAHKYFDIRIL